MDFRLHGDVCQRDGEKLGELRHVIYDLGTTELVALVVKGSGLRGRAVVVPAGAVDGTEFDGDSMYLSLSPQQFDLLEPYAFGRNTAPPPEDLIPDEDIHESVRTDDFERRETAMPVGAATGVTSIAFTPILEISRHVGPNDAIIDRETVIEAFDGEIGSVTHVRVDDQTRRVSSLIVEAGANFTREVEVPFALVSHIQPERITVKALRSDFLAEEV